MRPSDAAADTPDSRQGAFSTTRWSVVAAAGAGVHDAASRAALETLCAAYWFPLYAYVRRRGFPPEDAQDLTQEFFHGLLSKRRIGMADPARGRFRSFLLASLKHFLSDECDRRRARKRGGGVAILSMDFEGAESLLAPAEMPGKSPEQIYERRWAMALLQQVQAALEEEYRAQGKQALFDALRGALAGVRERQPYGELSRALGMSEGAVRVAVHRLRKRYRCLLHDAVAQTVADPADVEDELRRLICVMAD